MYQLGYRFDLGADAAPVDLSAAGITGLRINVRNAQNINAVVFKSACAAAGTDPVLTINQWQASSGGVSAVYSADHYWKKSAATLANTETWTNVYNTSDGNPPGTGTNTINTTVTLTGENQKQGIYVVELNVKNLLDGYDYVSVDIAKAGTVAQLGSLLYVAADLVTKRTPANLQPALF